MMMMIKTLQFIKQKTNGDFGKLRSDLVVLLLLFTDPFRRMGHGGRILSFRSRAILQRLDQKS